jgi:hypothetical protein
MILAPVDKAGSTMQSWTLPNIGRSAPIANPPRDSMTSAFDSRKDQERRGQEEELAAKIRGYIERKACGRIRDLQVVCQDDLIILQGRSRTYHAKQLAQEAVFDLTDGHSALANQIEVC